MRRGLRRGTPDRFFFRFWSPRRPGDPALTAAEVAFAVLPVAIGAEGRVLVLNPGLRWDAGLC